MIQIHLANETALVEFAQDFALALRIGDCVALQGDLGTGKSTFARAVIRTNAGDFDRILDVPSPTFTLIQLYEGRLPIAHMDLYRLSDAQELDELGLDTALESGAALIEWPCRAEGNLPEDLIRIEFSEPPNESEARLLEFTSGKDFLEGLTRSLNIRSFLDESGYKKANRIPFPGDASTRTYEFIQKDDANLPLILMDAPKEADGPPDYDGLPYSQIVHLAEDVRPFVAISNLLRSRGFCAPKILAHNMPEGLLLLENLGDQKIVSENNEPLEARYLAAVEILAEIHGRSWPENCSLPDGTYHKIPRYDIRAMKTGLSLLPDWWGKEHALPQDQIDALYALWLPHFEHFQDGYEDLIIRDYHSPNIIWRDGLSGKDKIGIIDHQDALIGPGSYDVASLMQDARAKMPFDVQNKILDHYCKIRSTQTGFDEAQTRFDIATLCAFRNSRLLGLWVRLDVRDKKSHFRNYEAQTKVYLQQALMHPHLKDLRDWYIKAGVIDAGD